MLTAPERKSFYISGYEQKEDGIYFYAKDYILRLQVKEHQIFRISCTMREDFQTFREKSAKASDLNDGWVPFAGSQGEHFLEIENENASVTETDSAYRISTGKVTLQISKETGMVKAYDELQDLIFSEQEKNPKSMERFEAFRTKQSKDIQVEKIKTADGEKNRILNGKMVSDGFMYRTKLSLSFAPDEVLIGLGQFEEGVFNLRGTTQYLNQANRKIVSPLLVSSKGYGLLLTTQSTAIFRDDVYGSYIYCEADQYLDYYLILHKDPEKIIQGMRLLTGKARMLPKWAFGYLQSKERYETEEEILSVARKFQEKQIPVDALILDWMSWGENLWGQKSFDLTRFPDPSKMIRTLHKMGIHFMMSIWPNMAEETSDYKEFEENGCLLPGTNVYDAFSKKGREIYQKQMREQLLCWGVEAFWCDSSEPVTTEWTSWFLKDPARSYGEYVTEVSKSIPMKYLNSYGLYHAQTIYDQMSKISGKRVCNLTRSGYPGSQKYGVILWSGDTDASWETLQKQLVAGISLSATGLPYWTFDIGAFFVKNGEPWYWRGDYPKGYEDEDYCLLYTRWFQLGAFLPVFRAHGTEIPREPWEIGDENSIYFKALKKAIDIRYSLMPYLYTIAFRVWEQDKQMMEPLCFAYPKDQKCWEIKDQFMLGPSLMVCPILTRESEREVYFPLGCDWYDYFTGEKYTGGQIVKIHKDVDEIPVFVPENSLIPTCEPAFNTQTLSEKIIVKRFGDGPCSFDLYEDDGDGYGYESGVYTITHLE